MLTFSLDTPPSLHNQLLPLTLSSLWCTACLPKQNPEICFNCLLASYQAHLTFSPCYIYNPTLPTKSCHSSGFYYPWFIKSQSIRVPTLSLSFPATAQSVPQGSQHGISHCRSLHTLSFVRFFSGSLHQFMWPTAHVCFASPFGI